jgi:hypothetical protein
MRSFVVVIAALAIACKGNEGRPIDNTGSSVSSTPSGGGSATAPAGDPFEKGLVELEAFRTRMCACADVPCTDKVFEEFKAWRVNIRKLGKRPSPDQEKKGNEIDKAMRACRSNVTAKPGSNAAIGSNTPPADVIEAAIVQLDGFKTRMCACKDKACADGVQADYAQWQRNLRAKLVEKPNKLQQVRGEGLEKEMTECRTKAESGTAGAPGGTSAIDTMLTQMQGFRDQICACTTKDCASRRQAEMKTWMEQAAKSIADAKPTKDQDAKADRLDAEMKACVAKLR